MTEAKPITFEYEVGGVAVAVSFSVEDARKVLDWGVGQAILHLGSEAPLLLEGLRKVFGESEA